MNNSETVLDRSYTALAHPARRVILDRLTAGPATIGEAASGLSISKPAVTKHVKVLEEAGIVHRSIEGRQHRLRLQPDALEHASSWLELHRALWESKFDVVERHLREQR